MVRRSSAGRRPVREPEQPSYSPPPFGLPSPARRGNYDSADLIALGASKRKAQEDEDASLWDNLGKIDDLIWAVPEGLGRLALSAGKTAIGIPRMMVDVGRGDLDPTEALKTLAVNTVAPWQREEWLADPANAAKYNPMLHEVGQSMGRTASRLRHPSRYVDAYNQGDIVGTVLEDFGNAAIVAGPLAKGLGMAGRGAQAAGAVDAAASLERAAAFTSRAGNLFGKTADLPISGPRALGRAGVRGLDSLAAKLPAGANAAGEAITLAQRMPKVFSPLGRETARAGRRAIVAANRRGNLPFRGLARVVDEQGILPDEQAAALALENSVADVDALIQRAADMQGVPLTPEQVRLIHQVRDLPEQNITAEAQSLTRQYLDGTLDPDVRARIDAGRAEVARQVDMVTQEALQGNGRRLGDLDPRQLEDAPFDDRVMQMLAEGGVDQATLDYLDNELANGATWDDLEQQVPGIGISEVLDNPQVYAARWRPSMEAALLARDSLTQAGGMGIPVRPDGLLAAGVTDPRYLPGGRSTLANPQSARIGGASRTRPGLPGVTGVGSENLRGAGSLQPYSFRALAEKLGQERSRTTFNKAVLDYAESVSRSHTVGAVLDPQTLTDLMDEANREAAAYRGTPTQVAQSAKEIFGQKVEDALANMGGGYEIFQGSITEPKVGDFRPDGAVRYAEIGPDTIILPTGLKRMLIEGWSPDLNIVLKALAKTNSFWKRNVLPFSVRWQLGDYIGGKVMAWAGGGVNPLELSAAARQVKKLEGDAKVQWEQNVLDNPDYTQESLQGEGKEWRQRGQGVGRDDPAKWRLYERTRRQSFKLNEHINTINRQGYVLAKLDKTLAERGLGDVASLGDDAAAWADPQVQAAITDVVNDANKVMGSFDDLTPWEQRYARQIWPFYAWVRHITKLTGRMAVDHPARVAWTLRLGAYGLEYQEELPPWLAGSINIGGQLFPTNWFNPFNDVVSGNMVQDPFKGMSPAIKLTAAALTGANLSNKTMQLTRPYGTGDFNETTGKAEATPLISRPAELAYMASQMLPMPRGLTNLLPSWDVPGTSETVQVGKKKRDYQITLGPHPRYQSGYLMEKKNGEPIDSNSRWAALASMFGIPWPTSLEDAEAIMAAGEQRKNIRAGQGNNRKNKYKR